MISTPNKLQEISPEAFAAFLLRLAPDAERAGEAYEELRQMLMKFFEYRRLFPAEDFADEVINRLIRRFTEGEPIENISGYCFSIARFILLEQARSPERHHVALDEAPLLAAPVNIDVAEDTRLACLKICLQTMSQENRKLVLEYYQDEKRGKVDLRQNIAERLGITRNALACRMVRLRVQLEKCVTRCAKQKSILPPQNHQN